MMTSSSVQHSSVSSNTRHIISTSNKRYEKTETSSQYSGTVTDGVPAYVSKETRLKSSSLPPGLALSQMVGQYGMSPLKLSLSSNEELTHSVKIGRSKSNAQKKPTEEVEENSQFNDYQQSLSERNLSAHQGVQGASMYKSMDLKFNVLAEELQKKFGSVGEEEELLAGANFEAARPDVKHRKNIDKSTEKIERYPENVVQHNITSEKLQKTKYQELDEPHEKQTSKKEESFFGRLLLRRSGKKNKKDSHNEKDEQIEQTKKQSTKEQFKCYSSEQTPTTTGKSTVTEHGIVRHQKMMCSDQSSAHKSIGQKVFSNQSHKRMDPRGGYVNDPILQESMTSYSKGSATEHGINDFKHFAEREKIMSDIQVQQSKSKDDVNMRRLSSENISKSGAAQQQLRTRQRMEAMDIPASPEAEKKPPLLPRTTSQESKGFFPSINQGKIYPKEVVNGGRYTKNTHQPSKLLNPSEDGHFPHSASPKIKMNSENVFFNSSSSSATKPADTNSKQLSYSVSPPRTIWPHNYDPTIEFKSSSQGSLDPQTIRNSKSDFETRYFDFANQRNSDYEMESSKARPKIAGLSSYQQKISHMGGHLDSDAGLSFPDSLTSRNPVVKSQSFRLTSDVIPLASQQEMPSLPPMFGISESSMDSWESTYKKNIKEANDAPTSLELRNDSLMSFNYKSSSTVVDESFTETDVFSIQNIVENKEDLLIVNSGLEDNLKPDMYSKQNKTSHYTKNINNRSIKARDDISRIEANIDSIIGSPKPLNCITLKSSSLDSVKSFTDKSSENRKAYSNESISNNKVYLNQPEIPDAVGSVSFNQKISPDAMILNLTDEMNTSTSGSPPPGSVSVTVLNMSEGNVLTTPVLKTPDNAKAQSMHFDFTTQPSAEKLSPKGRKESKPLEKVSPTNPSIPEFMKIQLNKVDQKPVSNVVLTTSTMNQINENKSTKAPAKSEKANDAVIPTQTVKRPDAVIERSISYEPKKTERFMVTELKKSESSDKNNIVEVREPAKPQRKFSSDDVEILERSDMIQNNAYNIQLKKTGSQTLLNRSTEVLTVESAVAVPTSLNFRKSSSSNSSLPPPSPTAHKNFIKKRSGTFDYIDVNNSDEFKEQNSPVLGTEQRSTESLNDKNSNQQMKRISSQELLVEQNSRIDRSSSSSDDCNLDSSVIFRKKSLSSMKSGRKDDEPELMKVFARRSLKLKDSETEAITQDILKITNAENKEEIFEEIKRNSKYDFNIMTRSRDSDKENEVDSPKDGRKKSISSSDTNFETSTNNKSNNKNQIEFRKHTNETAELMQAQRMPKKLLDSNPVSLNTATTNNKSMVRPATITVTETKNSRSSISTEPKVVVRPTVITGPDIYRRAISSNIPLLQSTNVNLENNYKDLSNFKKEVSESTPEKRFRNRTFPSNTEIKEDENIKTIGAKMESIQYTVDSSSLPKRPWTQVKTDDNLTVKESSTMPFRKSSLATPTEPKVIAFSNSKSLTDKLSPVLNLTTPDDDKTTSVCETTATENGTTINEADASPQFKGILQMRAEWERRAKQAMTK